MRQGRANRDVSESHAVTRPRAHAINPGGVGQLGEMQGSHVTSDTDSSYRGEELYKGKGFGPPAVKSMKTTNNGSQGRY